ncbi:hypothetical protein PUN28_012970 [Cardiocondyla obscurior]|uniref:Uncharacterized protein n=1 Tax=Cardiocondyla obscurior TaxID=286306 RepID=A0AAW2FBV3_9HYME
MHFPRLACASHGPDSLGRSNPKERVAVDIHAEALESCRESTPCRRVSRCCSDRPKVRSDYTCKWYLRTKDISTAESARTFDCLPCCLHALRSTSTSLSPSLLMSLGERENAREFPSLARCRRHHCYLHRSVDPWPMPSMSLLFFIFFFFFFFFLGFSAKSQT